MAALSRPAAVPIIRPAISPIAQPVKQCRVAFAAMLLRASMGSPTCFSYTLWGYTVVVKNGREHQGDRQRAIQATHRPRTPTSKGFVASRAKSAGSNAWLPTTNIASTS